MAKGERKVRMWAIKRRKEIDYAKEAEDNWRLAKRHLRDGDKERADAAMDRAIENEHLRDSWLYRWFGW